MERQTLEQSTTLAGKMADLERKMDFLMERLNLTVEPLEASQLFPEVEALIKQNCRVEAISAYQMHTGANLPDASSAVEAMATRPL